MRVGSLTSVSIGSIEDLMRDALKRHFGYEEFRPLQEEIITRVLNGKDCVVLMPRVSF